jgi:hypothetical protein
VLGQFTLSGRLRSPGTSAQSKPEGGQAVKRRTFKVPPGNTS